MNVAESFKAYYEHPDFIGGYAQFLGEDVSNCIDAIKRICRSSYNFSQWYGKNIYIADEQAEQVLNWFIENQSEETDETYENYYVGDSCIDSVCFGEQEEQLTGIYNRKTGKDYSLKYLQRAFDEAGYFVSKDLAYYDLSDSGVKWDIRSMPKDEFKAIVEGEK